MISLGRKGWAIASVLLALGAASGGRAQLADAAAPRALASNGAVVIMPDIATLDCDGMAKVLHRIDLSNYRNAAPVPEGHPDRAIFDYEDRLSIAYYRRCGLGESRLEDPGPAFASGFAPPTD
jgi:hypothetical protein